MAELWSTAKLSDDIRSTGLKLITTSFHRGPDWSGLFRSVEKLDIFFAYGRTWRGSYAVELRRLATNKKARIRVILPDPDNQQVISELSRRFCMDAIEVRNLILGAQLDFHGIFMEQDNASADFTLWYFSGSPLLSYYRFDKSVIISTYKHRYGRSDTLTLVADQSGELFSYVIEELHAIMEGKAGSVRLVLQSKQKT